MDWLHAISYFFGGAFFANVVPFGMRILAMGLFCARHFGSLHGGNTRERI
ncbi:hypothetical protein [Trinickia violacea]|nr:hypothetical protein [Trinickia violacea]